jgi:tetratricopeptide (TPR) repeat protein
MYKSCAAVLLVAVGDLDGAARATRETHNFAEQNSLAWIFLEWYIRGSIAFYRGQLDEALQYFRQGRKIEPATFQLGMLAGALFRVLAAKGDSEAEAALADARRFLPVPGRQLSYGSCECLALVLEGLAISGRLEEAAALRSEAEDVVANGAMCLTSLYLFRVAAGIAAAAARDWEQAEQHFGIAIQQADSAPYRTAQPIARLRYAEMLIAREGPQDLASAQELLREALRLFESVGMTWYAQQTAARIAAFGPNA